LQAGIGDATLDAEQDDGVAMVKTGPRVFDGGNLGRAKGTYTPVLQRERQEEVEVVNERYRVRKGWDVKKKVDDEDGDE
jgi:tRNA pseudouridine38/39 synthase